MAVSGGESSRGAIFIAAFAEPGATSSEVALFYCPSFLLIAVGDAVLLLCRSWRVTGAFILNC